MSIDYEKADLYKVKAKRKRNKKKKGKAIINGYEVDFDKEIGSYDSIVKKYTNMPVNPEYLKKLGYNKKD